MRILVVWGSKLGGTEGIARIVAEELRRGGNDVVSKPASEVRDASGYGAVIVGGALYANRWHPDAYRFVKRNIAALRSVPTWLFSSGPLNDSADTGKFEPLIQLTVLAERIGALGNMVFGGRLPADAKGFPASAMAKTLSGDWRNPDRIRAWATEIVQALADARPGIAVEPPAGSIWRLLTHGAIGWVLCALLMGGLMSTFETEVALLVHAIAAPIVFAAVSYLYFSGRGARDPLPTAITFTAIVAALDATIVAPLVLGSYEMFSSVLGTWLPFALILLSTWITGYGMSMIPIRRSGQVTQ